MNLSQAGNLVVTLNGGYVPAVNSAFQILTYPSATTGTFSSANLPPGVTWQTTYGATALTIKAVAIVIPAAQFTATPTNGAVQLPVSFTGPTNDSASNAIVSWNWNFGDGTTSTLQSPSHTYTNATTFSPSLIVTNNQNTQIAATGPSITVGQGTPVLTWANPAPIFYGTPLTANQLNAAANVPGTFSYNPASGTVLNVGTNTLAVVFTPTDSVDYKSTNDSVTVVVTPNGECDPSPTGLISWWPGDGNALDSVGTNNGTLDNVAFASAEVGEGFDFTNVNSAVLLGDAASLQLQSFAIEGWIQRSSPSIVTEDPSAVEGNALFFGFGTNGYGFGLFPGGSLDLTKIDVDNITSGASVSDTNWHHVAVTKAGSTVIFYVDGVAYPAGPYNDTFQFSTPAAIGARGDHVANGFVGQLNTFFGIIDELSIYNRALSSNEIAMIYDAGSAGKCTGFDGTQVTGALTEGSTNLFDPANNGVPPGYANTNSPTITLGPGDNTFGFQDSYNTDTADFNGTTLTVTDAMNANGALPWTMTFTDAAVTGITPVSDNFINGGIAASVTGDTITLKWAGSYSPSYVLTGTFTARFSLSSSALPLSVVTATPSNGVDAAPLNTEISAVFNQGIDPGTLTASNFIVRDASNTVVPGVISYNPTNLTATFTPNSALQAGVTYTADLTTNVVDLQGSTLPSNYTWSFTCWNLIEPNIGPVILAANDDESTAEIPLPFPVHIYGNIYSNFWINNNGNVTFTGPLGTYTAFAFPNSDGIVIIAPFFAERQHRGGRLRLRSLQYVPGSSGHYMGRRWLLRRAYGQIGHISTGHLRSDRRWKSLWVFLWRHAVDHGGCQ